MKKFSLGQLLGAAAVLLIVPLLLFITTSAGLNIAENHGWVVYLTGFGLSFVFTKLTQGIDFKSSASYGWLIGAAIVSIVESALITNG